MSCLLAEVNMYSSYRSSTLVNSGPSLIQMCGGPPSRTKYHRQCSINPPAIGFGVLADLSRYSSPKPSKYTEVSNSVSRSASSRVTSSTPPAAVNENVRLLSAPPSAENVLLTWIRLNALSQSRRPTPRQPWFAL